MAYWDQAQLSRDGDFTQRLAAVGVVEVAAAADDPLSWAQANQWTVGAAPGFADAYASAVASGNPRPGQDPAVISDAMLLAAVQALFPA